MNCKFILILTTTLFAVLGANAQYENVWVFGQRAGLDFSAVDPDPIQTSIEGFGEANASVCDANGQLLFYTEGSKVWNRNNTIMPNGTNLTPITGVGLTPTSSTSQGALIMPVPGKANLYYIFSLTSYEEGRDAGKLFYSVVDISGDGGLGVVVPNQKGILLDSSLLEKMTAVVGNDCNIWLLVCSNKPAFKAYEITASGINPNPVVSSVGLGDSAFLPGCMVVSPDHKKLAATRTPSAAEAGSQGAVLCDFDINTGIVSNPLQLLPTTGAYGICFSPDNSKLYVDVVNRSTISIYQYDLSSNDPNAILNSKSYLGPGGFSHLKLAPNGKIYFKPNVSGNILGAINLPNLSGSAAQYTPNAITLLSGSRASAGLPNVVPVLIRDTVIKVQKDTFPCFTKDALLQAADLSGADYIWNDSSLQKQHRVTRSGTYWVKYHTPPCVWHTDSFIVWFPSGALPELHTSAGCAGEPNANAWLAKDTADQTQYRYAWRDSNNTILSTSDSLLDVPAGTYTVQIRTSTGCDTTLRVALKALDYQVSFSADSISCIHDAVVFKNTSDAYFTDFRWRFDATDSSVLANPAFTYTHPGNYTVRLIGKGSLCADTAFKTVIIDSPAVSGFVRNKDSLCVGESVVFTTTKDSTLAAFYWQFGDGNNLQTTDTQIQHAYDAAGIMPVQMTSHFRACPDSSFRDTVYVAALPVVNLGADTALCLDGAPITLFNLRSQPGRYRSVWNTGDTTDTLVIRHYGNYRLQVRTPEGCTASETIVIKKSCYINIPNAFTPNGDGVNDYFFPRQLLADRLTEIHVVILNRWGEVVFESHDPNGRGWDGKLNGKPQPEGVYIYQVDAEINDVHHESYQGNVTLIR